jgi:hypothetical protein
MVCVCICVYIYTCSEEGRLGAGGRWTGMHVCNKACAVYVCIFVCVYIYIYMFQKGLIGCWRSMGRRSMGICMYVGIYIVYAIHYTKELSYKYVAQYTYMHAYIHGKVCRRGSTVHLHTYV